jgi:uncharacterized RDD family membrane protein YckC
MENNTATDTNPYTAPGGDLSVEAHSGHLAGRGARLGAAIIDGLILGLLTTVPLILVMGGWAAYVNAAAAASFLFKIILSVIGLTAYVVVNGMLLARDGQTVGKKLVGIKIVRADGSKADLMHILLRRVLPIYVCQFIPFIGWLLLLADDCCIFRDSKQCLHDQIADTVVIDA